MVWRRGRRILDAILGVVGSGGDARLKVFDAGIGVISQPRDSLRVNFFPSPSFLDSACLRVSSVKIRFFYSI